MSPSIANLETSFKGVERKADMTGMGYENTNDKGMNLFVRPQTMADMERVETKDHMTVQSAINLLANDTRQLLEEISELRARLSPILADYDLKNRGEAGMPVRCKMAAELYDALTVVHQCRELVELTSMQLDL